MGSHLHAEVIVITLTDVIVAEIGTILNKTAILETVIISMGIVEEGGKIILIRIVDLVVTAALEIMTALTVTGDTEIVIDFMTMIADAHTMIVGTPIVATAKEGIGVLIATGIVGNIKVGSLLANDLPIMIDAREEWFTSQVDACA